MFSLAKLLIFCYNYMTRLEGIFDKKSELI